VMSPSSAIEDDVIGVEDAVISGRSRRHHRLKTATSPVEEAVFSG
jgi:hypothetical protein